MGYNLLAFDVDNTITNSCSIIDDEMTNIFNILSKKFTILFISGTDCDELQRMISSKLSCDHYLLGNSGNEWRLFTNKKSIILYANNLNKNEVNEIKTGILNLIEKFKLHPLTSTADQILERGSQITLSILGRNAKNEEKKRYDPNREKRKRFISYLNTILPENKYDFFIGGTTSIDFTKKGNDKGNLLDLFIEKNNINKEKVLFFGDQLKEGGNDFSIKKKGFDCQEVLGVDDTKRKLKKIINPN